MRTLSHSESFISLVFDHGLVAQSVERLPEEQRVGGSSPSQATMDTCVAIGMERKQATWNTRERAMRAG